MGLGGAETHVLELALELARRGHNVTVASCGGVYVSALEAGGVRHVCAPLDSKKPACVAEATKALSRLMREERFDIVHAHARIPAFICGKLREKFGFAFITTAHFDFKVNALLARITNWGDHILSVSSDIADNIVKNYAYPRERITLVNNGIDTARFCPENDGSAVKEELGVSGKKVVMYLGRLDEDSSLGARALLESAPALYSADREVRVLIVGNGKLLEDMRKRAAGINEEAGERIAILPGGTPRAAEYIAASDVFAAPSRSAMEALASGKPTVVAGNFGMLGVFSPEIAEEASRTNFCCRGSELPTAEKITECVLRVLSMNEKERRELALYGRSFIEKYYSVRAMCDVCEGKYRELLLEKKKNIVICGYYGYGNAGDEEMLASLVTSLAENQNIGNICVMSATPKKTAHEYGVRAVDRFNFTKVSEELAKADVMIFGGGNILQDKTSTKSLLYYIQVLRMARKHACRIALCANGLGPIVRAKNTERVREALMLADYISIRDEASLMFVRELTGRDDIFPTSDLVCAAQYTQTRRIFSEKEKYFVVCPKKIRGFNTEAVADLCAEMREKYGLMPVFVPMHEKEDDVLCASFAARTGGRCLCLRKEELASLFLGAEFSVCMRLHAVIFSLMAKCPMIGISDDGKVSSFISSVGSSECAFFPVDVSGEDICVAVRKILENRANIRDTLGFEAARHREKARKELERLAEFISG